METTKEPVTYIWDVISDASYTQLGGNAERRAFVQQRFGDGSLLLGTADTLIAVSAQEGKGAVGRYVVHGDASSIHIFL